jgi:hypothetical protein
MVHIRGLQIYLLFYSTRFGLIGSLQRCHLTTNKCPSIKLTALFVKSLKDLFLIQF